MPTATASPPDRPLLTEEMRADIQAYLDKLPIMPSPLELREQLLSGLCGDAIGAVKRWKRASEANDREPESRTLCTAATTLVLEFARGLIPGKLAPLLPSVVVIADELLPCLLSAGLATGPSPHCCRPQLRRIESLVASIDGLAKTIKVRQSAGSAVSERLHDLIEQDVSPDQIRNMTGLTLEQIAAETEAVRWAKLMMQFDGKSFACHFVSTLPPGFVYPIDRERMRDAERDAVEPFDLKGREKLSSLAYQILQLRGAGLI